MINVPDEIEITIKRPVRNEYHMDRPDNRCAPMAQGRGCYGDCYDCYNRDVERYTRALKQSNPGLS